MPEQATGTRHPLPFERLSAGDFERLCLWLVEREGYEGATYIGARGQDGGRDVEAWKNGKRIHFQCKRVQDFQPAQAKTEIDKLRKLPAQHQPDIVHFLLTCNPKASTIDKAREAWGDAATCLFWGRDHLDERVRRHPEVAGNFFDLGDRLSVAQGYRCQAPHPGHFIHRKELDDMVEQLTAAAAEDASSTLAITTALQGAGGFGKTSLAQALCHDSRVREAFPDGILWTVMGEGLNDAGRIRAILEPIRGWSRAEPPAFETAGGAGAHLRELLRGLRVLVVVDDVWNRADVRPVEGLGAGSALLITTRNRDTLPSGTRPIDVDQMERDEATRLLTAGMDATPALFEPLAHRLGEWPLLLKLVNGQLRKLTGRGLEVAEALARVEKKLSTRGLRAFDRSDAAARNDAVRLTMSAGFASGVLAKDDQDRYRSLAIFPEDTDVPVAVLAVYRQLEEDEAFEVCERLYDLSLLLHIDPRSETVRLHDVYRQYLIDEQGTGLAELHRRFLAAHRPASGRWADLPPAAEYLWLHLAHHLIGAGEASILAELLIDPDYLQAKLDETGINALLGDFRDEVIDQPRELIADALRKSAHCLGIDPAQLAGQLIGRIAEIDEPVFRDLTRRLRGRPGLSPRRGSLRPSGGPLRQTLQGHTNGVLAVAPLDGGRIVSASSDNTLRVWDVESGNCLHTLGGHTFWVRAVAPLDGGRIVSASDDNTLRVWDVESGNCLQTLEGHTNGVGAVAPLDGGRIVSASYDHTLRVWDVESGNCLQTLEGHTYAVRAVAPLDGGRIVSASYDNTLRVWDVESGNCLHTLEGHTDWVRAVAPVDGGRIVSASSNNTLRVWDVEQGATIAVFTGEGPISAFAVVDSSVIVAGDASGRVHILNLIEPSKPSFEVHRPEEPRRGGNV